MSPDWKEVISRSIPYGDYTLDEVVKKVDDGLWQLWSKPGTAVITSVRDSDAGREVIIHFGAGDGSEKSCILQLIESWGRSIGAYAVYLEGRKGWVRALRRYGYEPTGETNNKLCKRIYGK